MCHRPAPPHSSFPDLKLGDQRVALVGEESRLGADCALKRFQALPGDACRWGGWVGERVGGRAGGERVGGDERGGGELLMWGQEAGLLLLQPVR